MIVSPLYNKKSHLILFNNNCAVSTKLSNLYSYGLYKLCKYSENIEKGIIRNFKHTNGENTMCQKNPMFSLEWKFLNPFWHRENNFQHYMVSSLTYVEKKKLLQFILLIFQTNSIGSFVSWCCQYCEFPIHVINIVLQRKDS